MSARFPAGLEVQVRTRAGVYRATLVGTAPDRLGRIAVYLNGGSKPQLVLLQSVIWSD